MSLKNRLNLSIQKPTDTLSSFMTLEESQNGADIVNLKEQMQALLSGKINSTPTWANYSSDEQKELIKQFIEGQLLNKFKDITLNKSEKDKLVKEIIKDAKGFGPFDSLLEDSSISYILVNGAKNVYAEKNGKLYKTKVTFKDNQHLTNIIERIISSTGKRIDEKSPIVEARLADGSRVNAVIPPLAIDGPSLSIRKFKKDAGKLENILKTQVLSNEMAEFLSAAVKAKLNIVISGLTGSGKTTLLNSLCSKIPNNERIITIEDSAELGLKQENLVRLETRLPNLDGTGQITSKDLIINALRMRPDRIIIGDCVGAEVVELLQALNTGLSGSLMTLHSNSVRNAVTKLETISMCTEANFSEKSVKSQIASAINLIVQINRLQDGSIKVTSISEIMGMYEGNISIQEIFAFEQTGTDGLKIIGHHRSTGLKPNLLAKLEESSAAVAAEYFNKEKKHSYPVQSPSQTTLTLNRAPSGTSGTTAKNKLLISSNSLAQRLNK